MVTLLHISDLHFGRPYQKPVGEAVLALANNINPDVVACSGDIVQWAESPTAWGDARTFFERFEAPVCAAPGNHDIARLNLWMRLLDPDRRYRQHILASTHRMVRAAGAVVISLATPRLWSAQLGYLSVKQLNAAHRQLAACQHGELRCVVLHHGLRQLSRLPKRDHLRGRRRATRALLQMGADIVMTGHNHFPHVERLGGPGGFIWSQAGTATSHRFRRFRCQQNSVSVVRADRDHIEIAWYYFKPESGRFIGGETHLFERS